MLGQSKSKLEFTTTYNVAEFTAEAAIDNETPRYLRIAGDVLSCNDFVELMTSLTSQKHKLLRPGGIKLLNSLIKVIRFFTIRKGTLSCLARNAIHERPNGRTDYHRKSR